MKGKRSDLRFSARLKSLRYAISGLGDMLKTESNAWIHLATTFVVLGLSWWLQIDRESLALIVVAVVSVWMAEAFNTVLELVVDIISSGQYSETARRAKDIAAGAVLIASVGATIIGLIVLGPPLFSRLSFLFS